LQCQICPRFNLSDMSPVRTRRGTPHPPPPRTAIWEIAGDRAKLMGRGATPLPPPGSRRDTAARQVEGQRYPGYPPSPSAMWDIGLDPGSRPPTPLPRPGNRRKLDHGQRDRGHPPTPMGLSKNC
jgi:hypothetical protein